MHNAQIKIPKTGIPIPKGWFKLRDGTKVYITHSGFGHYPGKKGKRIVNEIKKIKPKYLLVEIHPTKTKDITLPSIEYEREIKIPEEKRSDIGWAIIAGNKVGAKIIGFDIPQSKFLENIYQGFAKYSKRLAILNTIAHPIFSGIWHSKSKKEKVKIIKIYKKAEDYLLKFVPRQVKEAIKKEGIKKLFKEWLNFLNLTIKEILDFDKHYFPELLHFLVRFPTQKEREKYMIKIVEKFAKKGKTAVVVGSGHIDIWIKNAWIQKYNFPAV
jgi:hypothetical protein